MRMMQVYEHTENGRKCIMAPAGAYRITEIGPDSAWHKDTYVIGRIIIPNIMYVWRDGWVGFDTAGFAVYQCKLEPAV